MNDSKKPTSTILKRVRTKWDDITKKGHLGLMDYLMRMYEKPSDPEFNFLQPDYISTKDLDEFFEAVFKPPESCSYGCDEENITTDQIDWIVYRCKRCGRTSWVHKDTLKMWEVLKDD